MNHDSRGLALTEKGRRRAESLPPLEDLIKAYRKAQRARGLIHYLLWRFRLWVDPIYDPFLRAWERIRDRFVKNGNAS